MTYHADYFQSSASQSPVRQSDTPWSRKGSLIFIMVASAALWAMLFSFAGYLIG